MTAILADPLAAMVLAVVVGLVVGSFLNVVVHRVPRMMQRDWREQSLDLLAEAKLPAAAAALRTWSDGTKDSAPLRDPDTQKPVYNVVVPRSACPSCGRRLGAVENVPVVSWLVLRGRCAGCGNPISGRYPVVELLGGLLAGLAIWRFGPTWQALAGCFFLWTLLALTFIDADTQLLPDSLTLPLLWAGLIANLFGLFAPLASAVIGAIAGYLSLWLVYWAFKLIRGKEGMGHGDFKLLAAIGAWLGWPALPLVILLSSVVGAVVGIALIVLRRHERSSPLPFGPYLAVAGMVALFWGDTLMQAFAFPRT
jgi:leader peptidase (prepilin peptidase)/N-methyltransferase